MIPMLLALALGADPAPAAYRWVGFADGDSSQVALYRGNEQVGVWCYADQCYYGRDRDGKMRLKSKDPPTGAPVVPGFTPRLDDVVVGNYGVVREEMPKLKPGETYYSVNGQRCSAEEAYHAVENGGNSLVDDSNKARLTVVGSPEDCQRVLDDLARHPELAPLRDRVLAQSYRPDHWAVTSVGMLAAGAPAVTVQRPPDARGRGAVVYCAASYEGPALLAEALRKADPNYRPLLPKNPLGLPQLPPWALPAGLVLLVLMLGGRRNGR